MPETECGREMGGSMEWRERELEGNGQSERCCGQKCRAGENRSQISRIWDVPSPASLSPTCFPAHPLPNCLPQEQEWQWGHNAILLICDLFSPALQLLSTIALTLLVTNVNGHLLLKRTIFGPTKYTFNNSKWRTKWPNKNDILNISIIGIQRKNEIIPTKTVLGYQM